MKGRWLAINYDCHHSPPTPIIDIVFFKKKRGKEK